jgi:hypothetical protein
MTGVVHPFHGWILVMVEKMREGALGSSDRVKVRLVPNHLTVALASRTRHGSCGILNTPC